MSESTSRNGREVPGSPPNQGSSQTLVLSRVIQDQIRVQQKCHDLNDLLLVRGQQITVTEAVLISELRQEVQLTGGGMFCWIVFGVIFPRSSCRHLSAVLANE